MPVPGGLEGITEACLGGKEQNTSVSRGGIYKSVPGGGGGEGGVCNYCHPYAIGVYD